MGAKLAGGGGKYQEEQNSDINVTPFVDVMLVLLIIFMVAAPMAAVTVKVDLPPAVAKPSTNPPKPVYISIQPQGRLFVQDNPTTLDELNQAIIDHLGKQHTGKERIYIRADKTVEYGDFMQVMNMLQDSGFYSVALVGEDKRR